MTQQELLDAIKAIPTKVMNLATWKKALIAGSVVILILGGTHFGAYYAGTKVCKSTAPPTITQTKPTSTVINKPREKNIVCGEEIKVEPIIDKKYKLQLKMYDNCKTTIAYYQVDVHCPIIKNDFGFGPGFLIVYDNTYKKLTPLLGGAVSYTRWFGNFGLNPQVRAYGAMDKSMFAGGADLMFHYKW